MTTPETNAHDPGDMPPDLQEAAKQRDEKRKAEELAQLATKAKEAHSIVVNAPRVVLQHAITAGAALNEAKAKVGHGKWLAWLKENCPDISDRTAERYMKLAGGKAKLEKKLQDPAKFDIMSDLTINEALRLIDEPDGEQSAAATSTEAQSQTGDAAANQAANTAGKSKGGNKGRSRKDSPKQLQKQIASRLPWTTAQRLCPGSYLRNSDREQVIDKMTDLGLLGSSVHSKKGAQLTKKLFPELLKVG